ncbi:MAG: Fur family transcriptional regulator [Campylobacterota bacterium]|nr:Fur family transcriptional regulator [Campylobacterota bacterium]
MNDYTQILREHNLKATPQRLAIANVLDARGHITIESLYEIMLKKFNSISLATIYKNINIMLENSFVQEVKIPHAKSVFELKKTAHSHLVCDTCGEVEDIAIDLSNIIDNVAKTDNFKIESASLILSGFCKNCQD